MTVALFATISLDGENKKIFTAPYGVAGDVVSFFFAAEFVPASTGLHLRLHFFSATSIGADGWMDGWIAFVFLACHISFVLDRPAGLARTPLGATIG